MALFVRCKYRVRRMRWYFGAKLFHKIICPVVNTDIPEYFKVALDHAVLEPPKPHVPSFRLLISRFLFDEGFCHLIIGFDRCRWLLVSHLV